MTWDQTDLILSFWDLSPLGSRSLLQSSARSPVWWEGLCYCPGQLLTGADLGPCLTLRGWGKRRAWSNKEWAESKWENHASEWGRKEEQRKQKEWSFGASFTLSGCIGASAPETAACPWTLMHSRRPRTWRSSRPRMWGSPVQCQPLGCPQTWEQGQTHPKSWSLLPNACASVAIAMVRGDRCWRAWNARRKRSAVSPALRCAPRLPPGPPAPRVCNVLVCHVVVPSVSKKSLCQWVWSPPVPRSFSQTSPVPAPKNLLLPPETTRTPPWSSSLSPQQPPALPPKPTARIGNHLPGEVLTPSWGPATCLPFTGSFLAFTWEPLASRPVGHLGVSVCVLVHAVVTWVCVCVCVWRHAVYTCQPHTPEPPVVCTGKIYAVALMSLSQSVCPSGGGRFTVKSS